MSFNSGFSRGNFVVEIKNLTMLTKALNYKHVHLLMERKDERGNPVPFSFKYIKLKGEIMEGENVVCTSANVKKKTHTIKFPESGQLRTIHDVLLISIGDTRIIVR